MINDGKAIPGNPDHGWSLWIISVVMVIVSGIVVSLRLALRLAKRTVGIDDYMIFLV